MSGGVAGGGGGGGKVRPARCGVAAIIIGSVLNSLLPQRPSAFQKRAAAISAAGAPHPWANHPTAAPELLYIFTRDSSGARRAHRATCERATLPNFVLPQPGLPPAALRG